ncbi:MAG: SusD/RagB family nutrient-binding outer membrane lipoprotein, partial [Aestuariibaculum sp.]
DTWNNIYTKVLPNITTVQEKAEDLNATHYQAVAKIITAMNVSFAVDNWDNVPYTQAGKPFEFPKPNIDDGKTVYNQMVNLLDEAIALLSTADTSDYSLGNDDLIYKGDTDKWMRLAYTFKARLQLHMLKNGGVTASQVLATISNGFTSNDDNFTLSFPEGEINPYYSTNILARGTNNFYYAPNTQIINMMNGNIYPFESGVVDIDPRLPAIYENEGVPGDPWRGFVNGGAGESSDGEPGNTFYKDGGFLTSSGAPLTVITYAEAMFIKAEAAFLSNGGTTTSSGTTTEAYNAYLDGITASMTEIGVDGADYLADTVVAVGESGLMLNHIMKEKYIANVHNTETYNDFRRYNFSPDVFKGLQLRFEEPDTTSPFAGEWIRRISYPIAELDANFDNIKANEKAPTESVWWAQ